MNFIIGCIIMIMIITKVKSFEFGNFFNLNSEEINTDEIKLHIMKEIENDKKNQNNDKLKKIIEKETELKNKLIHKIKENIKKQY